MFTPRYLPLPREDAEPPSRNALGLSPASTIALSRTEHAPRYNVSAFGLPTPPDSLSRVSSTTTSIWSNLISPTGYTKTLATSGLTSFGRSVQETYPSSLDRSQNNRGDVHAFPFNNSTHGAIPVDVILEQIQGVGYAQNVDEILTAVKALLDRPGAKVATREATVYSLRMKAITVFCEALYPSSGIRLFSEDEFKAALPGRPFPDDAMCTSGTKIALNITLLLTEFVKAGVSTSSDLVTAATLLYYNRHVQGYIPLLYLLLGAGKNFVYTYSDWKFLMGMRHDLKADEGSMATAIRSLLRTAKCAPRR